MTFNENARIDTSRVQRRRGGRGRSAAIGGGGVLIVVALALASQLFGIDLGPLSSMFGGSYSEGSSSSQVVPLESCETGADANANDECRMAAAANSLDTFWQNQFESGYREPGVILYQGYTDSACGTASAAIGPFYCLSDESIYIDVAFFQTLRSDFDATAGPLAQMYVLAHEWGHHISNLTGQLSPVDRQSGSSSGSVRLELQADCYAGSWVRDASTVPDAQGVPFMKPVSPGEMTDAMNAAAAIGDDSIQKRAGQDVNPDAFSHGSSEQRQFWFQTGYTSGAVACDTFSVPANEL